MLYICSVNKTQNNLNIKIMNSQKLGGYPKFVKIITNVDVNSGVILTNRDLINAEYERNKVIYEANLTRDKLIQSYNEANKLKGGIS